MQEPIDPVDTEAREWLAEQARLDGIEVVTNPHLTVRASADHHNRVVHVRPGLPWPVHYLSVRSRIGEILFPHHYEWPPGEFPLHLVVPGGAR